MFSRVHVAISGAEFSRFIAHNELREWSRQILHVRQKGDFRSDAIKRIDGAGTDARGRYICIGSGYAHGVTEVDSTSVENDDEWE